MKTFEYIRCIYNTLRSAKKGKYDYRDYKWVLGYEIYEEIYKNIYIQNTISSHNDPLYLFGIELEVDKINPYTLKLYEDITNKISITSAEISSGEYADKPTISSIDKLKESMEGLTMEQAKMLRQWAEGLWVLLDQDDYNNIAKIFKNAVGREVEYQEGQNEN